MRLLKIIALVAAWPVLLVTAVGVAWFVTSVEVAWKLIDILRDGD
jgi:hypothetical protein